MEKTDMNTDTDNKEKTPNQLPQTEELLKLACEMFAKKLRVSNQKLTYDGTGKITYSRMR